MAGTALAAAVTIAVCRYRLYDIDIIINRTLVYLLLSGIIAGGYIAIVTGVGALVPRHGLTVEVLAAGLAAVVFSPLRARLQTLVNRMMYGERDNPYAALSRLATRLEATLSPDQVLTAIAGNVASALRSPYAAIEVADGDKPPRIAAVHGTLPPGAAPLRVPLTSPRTGPVRARDPGSGRRADHPGRPVIAAAGMLLAAPSRAGPPAARQLSRARARMTMSGPGALA